MFIETTSDKGLSGATSKIYLPKSIEVTLTFNPIHDFEMGFNDGKTVNSDQFGHFPYGTGTGGFSRWFGETAAWLARGAAVMAPESIARPGEVAAKKKILKK